MAKKVVPAGDQSAQIARIRHFEELLDRLSEAVKTYENAAGALEGLRSEIDELAAYYGGALWRRDFEDDEAGLLPKDLKRGVLSEDAVYDLLGKIGEYLPEGGEKGEKNMNEVIKAMKERRSIRRFKPDMPDKSDIDAILDAGLYAASGMGRQPVITLAVTNKEERDRLAETNRKIGGWKEGFDPFYGAPVILVVLADKNHPTYKYDGSLVMGNLMLAAHSLGLGSIWIHRAKEEFELPEYKEMLEKLGIKGEWEGIGHCAVGYIDGEVPPAAPRKEGRIYFVE